LHPDVAKATVRQGARGAGAPQARAVRGI